MRLSIKAYDPSLHAASGRRSGVSGSVTDQSGGLSLYSWVNRANGNEHEYQLGPRRGFALE
jgi:hypothetical protein